MRYIVVCFSEGEWKIVSVNTMYSDAQLVKSWCSGSIILKVEEVT